MGVNFFPQKVDFGAVFAGTTGPDSTQDGLPGTGGVMFYGGPGSPAGNVTASIKGDTTHFSIRSVTVYKVIVHQGLHYEPLGSSNGVTPVAVLRGQAVVVDVQYDVMSATGVLSATLEVHGDTPDWAPDSLIPLSLSIIPVRTIKTVFGSQEVKIPPDGQGQIPITVTNVTGPATDVTYSLPQGWGPTTSIAGVAVNGGLLMDDLHFQQLPAGGTRPGLLHFTFAPASTLPPGSYPFSIAMWAFGGIPPNNNNPVAPELTLNLDLGQISVTFAGAISLVQVGGILEVQVPIRIALGSHRGVATVVFTSGALPAGISMASPQTFFLSANDNPVIPDWPANNVDAAGSLAGNIGLEIDTHALTADNPLAMVNWSAYNGQQTGSLDIRIPVRAPRSLPLAPVDLQPHNGASGVSKDPYLSFRDPGAGTVAAADNFAFIVSQNNVIVDPSHTLTGPATTASPLSPPGLKWFSPLPPGVVSLEVWGINAAGTGPGYTSTFTVSSPSPSSFPQITAAQMQNGQNIVLSGGGFEAHTSVTVVVDVQNKFGQTQDLRHGSFTLLSTNTGSIAKTFNPVDYFGGQTTPFPGMVAQGEIVSVIAANTDAGSVQPGHPGVSNEVKFNWQ